MEPSVVVPLVLAYHAVVFNVVICLDIMNLMAIMVVAHIGRDVCVVVSVVNRSAEPVMGREVVPVPR